jgi:mono/diheme cytochrome c family protein
MLGVEIVSAFLTLGFSQELNRERGAEVRDRPQWMVVASGICPQKRGTRSAPRNLERKANPLPSSTENLNAGEQLYQKDAKPTACRMCHGIRGNGNGRLAPGLEPPPRNFTCAETMKEISDGQLFWVIKNGSKRTAMPAHKSTLTDSQIWQLIHYLRQFAE